MLTGWLILGGSMALAQPGGEKTRSPGIAPFVDCSPSIATIVTVATIPRAH